MDLLYVHLFLQAQVHLRTIWMGHAVKLLEFVGECSAACAGKLCWIFSSNTTMKAMFLFPICDSLNVESKIKATPVLPMGCMGQNGKCDF